MKTPGLPVTWCNQAMVSLTGSAREQTLGAVQRLVVNGNALELDRPCIAVIDTGTTGLSVSESLFCNAQLGLGARVRRARRKVVDAIGAVHVVVAVAVPVVVAVPV